MNIQIPCSIKSENNDSHQILFQKSVQVIKVSVSKIQTLQWNFPKDNPKGVWTCIQDNYLYYRYYTYTIYLFILDNFARSLKICDRSVADICHKIQNIIKSKPVNRFWCKLYRRTRRRHSHLNSDIFSSTIFLDFLDHSEHTDMKISKNE